MENQSISKATRKYERFLLGCTELEPIPDLRPELIQLKAENERLKESNKYMRYALWIITIISTVSLIGKYYPLT